MTEQKNKQIVLDAYGEKRIELLPGSWRNFSGQGTAYNASGNRNFNILINDIDLVQQLEAEGYNVKTKEQEDGLIMHYIKVNVKFGKYPPIINLYTEGNNQPTSLTEDEVDTLDNLYITDAIVAIRPYRWSRPDGSQGTTAYLTQLSVKTIPNRFDERFREEID